LTDREAACVAQHPNATPAVWRVVLTQHGSYTLLRWACQHAPVLAHAEMIDLLVALTRPSKDAYAEMLLPVLTGPTFREYWRYAVWMSPRRAGTYLAQATPAQCAALTTDDLAPFYTHPDSAVRLAAIAAMAQVQNAPDASDASVSVSSSPPRR
jgi:hypothetical protein